ncbi:MAG TPA: ferritin-like domain-containing protein [Bryobacteraceae bacterium]|nr:ferritin-like domain-containing protein [Bryobacteraceae bacterium]
MATQSVRELLIEQMKDLYDAEKQLVKALPKMAKNSSNEQLREAFENHLEQTRGHVERLEQAFEMLEEKAKSKPCEAMKGLVEEGKETMEEDLSEPLKDSAIICAAQKVEHYEMAGYGTVKAWAQSLGLDEVAELFESTLNEEKEADEKLNQIAGEVLSEAESGEGEEEGEMANAGAAPRRAASSRSGNGSRNKRRAG